MSYFVRTLGTTVLLTLTTLTIAHAQSPSGEEVAQRDSLARQQEAFIQSQFTQKSYGIKEIDRLFRHEPPYPYNQDRGYEFLRAFANSQARNHETSGGKPSTMKRIIQWATGTNINLGKWQIGVDGILDLIPERNRVDGQWLGYELQFVRWLGEGRSIRLRTSNNYTLCSRQWFSENHLMLYYAPQRDGLFVLSGGRTSRETTHLTPEEIYRGYYGVLPGTNSPVRDYEKIFVTLRNRINLGVGLDLSTSLIFEDRKSQVTPALAHHRALVAEGQLLWAPTFLNPSITTTPIPVGFRKELGLIYRQALRPQGIDQSTIPYSEYSMVEGFVRGCIPMRVGSRLDFKISIGGYLSHGLRTQSDEKYFAHISLASRTPLRQAWATMPLDYTGGEGWTTQEVNYLSGRFLLSHSRAFGEFLKMDDALHLKNFIGLDGRAYTEAGYSIGWGELARLGLFAGYDHQSSRARVALRLSLPILSLTSSWSERR